MSNIFQIKRGSGAPTTTALSLDGELGYDKTNKTLYINNNGVIEIPFARFMGGTINNNLTIAGENETRSIYVTNNSGSIGFFSNATANDTNRGIWLPPHGTDTTGKAVITVDTNNNITYGAGTMNNMVITMKANQYDDDYTGALNMSNSNIYGVNSIYMADVADSAQEGISFYRSATKVDTIHANNGVLYFTPNRTLGTTGTSYEIYHANTTIPASKLTGGTINGNIYIGEETDEVNRYIYLRSRIGSIGFYSNGSGNNNKGVWLQKHGTDTVGVAVISADTNNNVSYQMGEIRGSAMSMTNGRMALASGRAKLFTNGIAISNPATANDQGWLRMTGTGESDSILELGIGDDGLAGEQVQVTSYNTSSAITHNLILLEKGTGNLVTPSQIVHTAASSSWRDGRTRAALRTLANPNDLAGYFPAISMKSYSGSWELGTYTTSNILYLSYMTDTNYSSNTNSPAYQINFTPNGDTGFYARNISYGTGDPSGGAVGDIYIKYS